VLKLPNRSGASKRSRKEHEEPREAWCMGKIWLCISRSRLRDSGASGQDVPDVQKWCHDHRSCVLHNAWFRPWQRSSSSRAEDKRGDKYMGSQGVASTNGH
jgi:hypothetical protein